MEKSEMKTLLDEWWEKNKADFKNPLIDSPLSLVSLWLSYQVALAIKDSSTTIALMVYSGRIGYKDIPEYVVLEELSNYLIYKNINFKAFLDTITLLDLGLLS